jgi:hypothetical protein
MFSTAPDFKAWFPNVEGFPRPDWEAIDAWIDKNVSVDRLDDAWQAITREWLQRICARLGRSYVVAESQNFHLLSELDEPKQTDLLSFLERVRARILRQLGDIHLPKSLGKHVILRFSDDEDYYRYIAYFDSEGEYAGSGGCFFGDGYSHIAYSHRDDLGADRATLVHELTHNLLVSFPLPTWLNEALAMAFERDMSAYATPLLTRELAEEHRAYWNPQTIEEFWCGRSFSQVEISFCTPIAKMPASPPRWNISRSI